MLERDKNDNSLFKTFILLTVLFFTSRIIYYLLGVRFDIALLYNAYQFADLNLLRTNFVQTIFFLHSQPPLFNIFIGLVLNCFENYELFFNIFFKFLGLLNLLLFYYILTLLKCSKRISLALSIFLILNPDNVLFENWFFYSYVIITLLLIALYSLIKLLKTEKIKYGIIFFSSISILILTRSIFQIFLVVIFLIFILVFKPKLRKIVLISASIPFLIVLLWYFKNYFVFGLFSTSSWFGMNFIRITADQLPNQVIDNLISTGYITNISKISPFSNLSAYSSYINITTTGIAILDNETKSIPYANFTQLNLNNINYIQVSKLYFEDSIKTLILYPISYLKGVFTAFYYFFRPANTYMFFDNNRKNINNITSFFNKFIFVQINDVDYQEGKYSLIYQIFVVIGKVGITIIILYTLDILYGFIKMINFYKKKDINHFVIFAFILFMILYVTFVSNLFEVGENMRFRYNIDPFLFILLGLFLTDISRLRTIKHKRVLSDF